jgi:tetratricopeptide (TPR) repeat protein
MSACAYLKSWRRSVLPLAGPAAALLLAVFATAEARSAPEPAAAFELANRLYEQGKYADATAQYEQLLRDRQVSPALYFNLGNTFYKSDQLGRALSAYRHAERLGPRDPDLRANLQFVRNQVQGPTLLPGRWQRWLGSLTLDEWTRLAAAALWLTLLLLATTQLRPAWKPPLRTPTRLGALAALLLALCTAAAWHASHTPSAIVISHDAAVHIGPLDESQTAFTVHDGAELAVLDRKDDWLQVSAGDRRLGWVKREQLQLMP